MFISSCSVRRCTQVSPHQGHTPWAAPLCRVMSPWNSFPLHLLSLVSKPQGEIDSLAPLYSHTREARVQLWHKSLVFLFFYFFCPSVTREKNKGSLLCWYCNISLFFSIAMFIYTWASRQSTLELQETWLQLTFSLTRTPAVFLAPSPVQLHQAWLRWPTTAPPVARAQHLLQMPHRPSTRRKPYYRAPYKSFTRPDHIELIDHFLF